MIAIIIIAILCLSVFCSFVLNKQYAAIFLMLIASSQMTAHASNVILVILFTAMLQFSYAFLRAKQNKSFLPITFLPIAYISIVLLILPHKIHTFYYYYYLGYLAALFVFAWVMLLKWDTKTIVEFLTAYGSYLILAGFLEKIFTSNLRVGLAMTVATAYAVVLVIVWAIWAINAYLSRIYSIGVILAGTFLVFLAIILSGTRMGLIGIFMGLGLCGLSVIFVRNKNINIIKFAVYSIVILSVLLLTSAIIWNLLPDDLFVKKTLSTIFAGKLDISNMGRVLLWISAIDAFEHNKFFGIGPGNFPEKCGAFLRTIGIYERPSINTHAHNIYLIILSEHGIIGFLTLGFFVFLCMLQSFLYFLKNRIDSRFYAFLSGFMIMCILGLVDATPMYLPTACFAAWLLGVCTSFRAERNIC